jgi:hypothetical protein
LKIYIAGNTMLKERERFVLLLSNNRLQSYYYFDECKTILELLKELNK